MLVVRIFMTAWLLINGSLDGGNACYVAYNYSNNLLYLISDTGPSAPLLGPVTPFNDVSGTGVGTMQNSQCKVSWSGSRAYSKYRVFPPLPERSLSTVLHKPLLGRAPGG